MEKIHPRDIDAAHPASAALHCGLYRDRTLREFEERKHIDPDLGTKYEGTVNEIPAPGEPFDSQALLAQATRPATNAPVAVAFSGQNMRARESLRWWDMMSPARRKQLCAVWPDLPARMHAIRHRVERAA